MSLGWPLPPLSLSCGKTAVTKLRTHLTFLGRPGEDRKGSPALKSLYTRKQLSHVLLESVLRGQSAKHWAAAQSPSAQPCVSKAPRRSPTGQLPPVRSDWELTASSLSGLVFNYDVKFTTPPTPVFQRWAAEGTSVFVFTDVWRNIRTLPPPPNPTSFATNTERLPQAGFF